MLKKYIKTSKRCCRRILPGTKMDIELGKDEQMSAKRKVTKDTNRRNKRGIPDDRPRMTSSSDAVVSSPSDTGAIDRGIFVTGSMDPVIRNSNSMPGDEEAGDNGDADANDHPLERQQHQPSMATPYDDMRNKTITASVTPYFSSRNHRRSRPALKIVDTSHF